MAQDEIRDKINQEKASYRVNDTNGNRSRHNGDTSQRDRNPPKFRESRRNTGYRRGPPKFRESEKSYEDYNNNMRKSEQNAAKENRNFADVVKSEDSKTIPNKQSVIKEMVTNLSEQDLQNVQQKSKPSHGHYHHKNSNKPRFAKAFSENGKEMKKQGVAAKVNGMDPGKVPAEYVSVESAAQVVEQLQTSRPDNESAKTEIERERMNSANAPIIDQLRSISIQLNSRKGQDSDSQTETEDVFSKLKNGEKVELDNLKQLYDKIPDLTKTEVMTSKEEENFTNGMPTSEGVLQDSTKSIEVSCEDPRVLPCCPHGACFPPMFTHPPHGFMPPVPHPAYYYAAMWNYHHPMPPPPVQRLASAPNLPSPNDTAGVHKRYITRSTKTPGSVVFALHLTDNLRIVSVRCEDSFSMTADLCNEEGEKVAENFVLHNETSPLLWEQYAFSGNHTLHFNLDAPCETTVVITFLHEVLLK